MKGFAAMAVACVLVAGCAAPPGERSPIMQPAEAAVEEGVDWSQGGCRSVEWAVHLPAEEVLRRLPPGFTLRTSDEEKLAGIAPVKMRVSTCTEGFGPSDGLRASRSGFVFTAVEPPESLLDAGVEAPHAFAWAVVISSAEWRDSAEAKGIRTADGDAFLEPNVDGWNAAVAVQNLGTFAVRGRTVGQPAPDSEATIRIITATQDGYALWDARQDNLASRTGIGHWTATPDSWVAIASGATSGIVAYTFTESDYQHATVTHL